MIREATAAAHEAREESDAAPAAPVEADVLDVAGAARLLRIGKHALYGLVGRNAVPHRRVGKHLRFSRVALLRWLEGEQAGGKP